MKSDRTSPVIKSVWTSTWIRTILIGIIGGIPFGVIIQFWMGDMIDVGALYGDHSVVRGWLAHLFHSSMGGVVFTGIVSQTRLKNLASTLLNKAGFGVAYGLLLWAVFIAVVLPIWLQMMTRWGGGTPVIDSKLRFPASFIGFLVYGLIVALGVRLPAAAAETHQNDSGNDAYDGTTELFESDFVWDNDDSGDQ